MAVSVKFEGFNGTLVAPKHTKEKDIYAFRDGEQAISCWRLSEAELKEIGATGVVWLTIRGPEGAPALVSGAALVNVGNRAATAEPADAKA